MGAGSSGAALRVGLAGVGRFGRLHARVLAALPGVELALCEPDRSRLEAAAAELEPAFATPDYGELLERGGVQAVDLVTPDALHVEMAARALERGLHAFVEKPLALDHGEALELARLAGERGLVLQVGFILRYEARHAYLKELLQSGRLGKVATLRLKRHAPQRWFHAYGHAVHPMLESTIHDIDLCLWYLGSACRRAYGVDRSFLGREGPDTSLAVLEFEGGAVALVEASWLVPEGAPTTTEELGGTIDAALELVGTEGTARIDFLGSGLTVWERQGTRLPELGAWPEIGGRVGGALRAELEDFVACVRAGEPSRVASLGDAVAGLAIVEAVRRSAREGRPVELGEAP